MLIHRSSLSRVASTWLVLTLASAAAAPADAQEDSVSGKNVVAMDGEFDPPLDCDQDILIGTLAKGLRGAVLTVHVTASEIEEGTVPRIAPEVNGTTLLGPTSIDGPGASEYGNAAVHSS